MPSLCPLWARCAQREFGPLGKSQSSDRGLASFHVPVLKLANVFFLRREGQVGCNFYSLKITPFKFMLRRRKEVTIEHKLIFCKKLETETERYDLTYRINTTYI